MRIREKNISKLISLLASLAIVATVFMNAALDVDAANYAAWSAVFDPAYYVEHCPEAKAYAGNNVDKLWQYFVKVGIPRGDQASEEFNVFVYASNYPDLVAAYGGNYVNYYMHYAQAGKKEGRNGKTLLSQVNTQATATTTTSQQVASTSASELDELLRLMNQDRANAGLAPLSTTPELMEAAKIRAYETVASYSHTRPDGRGCFTVLEECGVRRGYAGENIYASPRTAADAEKGWMESPGHRANILNSHYKHVGLGLAKVDSGWNYYWVQIFTD